MLKKTLVNCFLVAWLAIMFIDSAPIVGSWHQSIREKTDTFLDVAGLWQGGWQLFAPEPDKINVSLKADILFPDDQTVVWRSPEWRTLSTWQRFKQFRNAEFIDNVRSDGNAAAWEPFANYLCRTVPHPEKPELKPLQIVLTREWIDIPRPNETNIKEFPHVPAMDQTFIFYAQEFKQ